MPYLTSPSHHSPSQTGQGQTQSSPYSPDNAGPPKPGFAPLHQNAAYPPDLSQHRGSGDFNESRRSSVDSRIHQGISNLGLGPTSPYASGNPSQTSLVGNLQRERGIQPSGSLRGPRYSTGGGPIPPPFGIRNGERGGFTQSRIAPPIMENPRQEVYSADVPTRGQAYAFPDPDAPPPRPQSEFSRRNSYAESFKSFGSSIYSDMSRLPAGQQGLFQDAFARCSSY